MYVSNIFYAIILFDLVVYLMANNSFWPPKILKPNSKTAAPKILPGKELFTSVGDKKKCMENSCEVFKNICGENGVCEQQDVDGSCQFSCRCYYGYHGVYCEFRDSDKATKGRPTTAGQSPIVSPALLKIRKVADGVSSSSTSSTSLKSVTTGMTTTQGTSTDGTSTVDIPTAGTSGIDSTNTASQQSYSHTDQPATTTMSSTSHKTLTELSVTDSKMTSTKTETTNTESTTETKLLQSTETWVSTKESTSKQNLEHQQNDSTVPVSSTESATLQPLRSLVSGLAEKQTTLSKIQDTTPVVTSSTTTHNMEKIDLMKILKDTDSSNLNR